MKVSNLKKIEGGYTMKYVLMRHENEDKIDHIYDEIKKIGTKRGNALNNDQIVERAASVLTNLNDPYVHDEVRDFVRQRNEQYQAFKEKALKEGIQMAPIRPNRLLEAATKIKQLSTEYPTLTIAYNDTLRTEVTAKAVSRVTGGTLVKASLYESEEVWKWMQNHKEEDGLAVIVTHQPAIGGVLGESAKDCDAFLVGEAYGRYRAVEILNLEGRI